MIALLLFRRGSESASGLGLPLDDGALRRRGGALSPGDGLIEGNDGAVFEGARADGEGGVVLAVAVVGVELVGAVDLAEAIGRGGGQHRPFALHSVPYVGRFGGGGAK